MVEFATMREFEDTLITEEEFEDTLVSAEEFERSIAATKAAIQETEKTLKRMNSDTPRERSGNIWQKLKTLPKKK